MEMARLFDAAKSRHILTYLLIACHTLARPSAILDLRGASLMRHTSGSISIRRADGRTRSFGQFLAVTPTLLPWLRVVTEPTQRYVA